jgi:hypothetical protein
MSKLVPIAMLKLLQKVQLKNVELTKTNQEMANEIEQLRAKVVQLEREKALLPPPQNLEITIERMIDEKLSKGLSGFTAP